MTCRPGDLVLIPFPYSDLEASKKRPVLALTAPDRHGDFIGLAVTSVAQTEHAIQIAKAQLQEGSLPRTSWIRLDKIFTLSENSIVKIVGKVQLPLLQEVLKGLCGIVGYTQ
jgi:mRNA interferase MazF